MSHKASITILLLSLLIVVSSVGCGLVKKKDSTDWQNEIRTQLPSKLSVGNMGQFYLQGAMYEFPTQLKSFLNNGWSYANPKDAEVTLLPHTWYKYKVELHQVVGTITKICYADIFNNSKEQVKLEDAMVGRIVLDRYSGNSMVSGGIVVWDTRIPTEKELFAYTDDGFAFDNVDDAGVYCNYTKSFKSKDGLKCTFTLQAKQNEENERVVSSITLDCFFTLDPIEYINITIHAVAQNDPSLILEIDEKADAQNYILSYRKQLAKSFIYYIGFDMEDLTDSQLNKVYAYMDKVYEKSAFQVNEKAVSTSSVDISVSFHAPKDFDSTIQAILQKMMSEYEGNPRKISSEPAFLDSFLDELLKTDFDYSFVYTTSFTYDGSIESMDNGISKTLISTLGIYEYEK